MAKSAMTEQINHQDSPNSGSDGLAALLVYLQQIREAVAELEAEGKAVSVRWRIVHVPPELKVEVSASPLLAI
jgi:hypothetical protein